MSQIDMSAEAVESYLQAHPEYFELHPEVLAGLSLRHPHGGKAVSLIERQIEVLREKNKLLERKLGELIHNAKENDLIAERLQKFVRRLLLVSDPATLPEIVEQDLREGFAVPQVALRLWEVRDEFQQLPSAQPVEVDVIAQTNVLTAPFCGPSAEFLAATWLSPGGAGTRSLALVPLRVGDTPKAFGLLAMGSADPERFTSSMGTEFLERIGEIVSATLSRLGTA